MRLKSLELQGFKSFPDKVTLQFDEGATVIVGPNGSGKSNITDAMRWVLGEISTKNIRGSKMEDVIFLGTEQRKQMNFAEVSVTFDNTAAEGRLNSDYDEITVTRRYNRNGDSEYYINRQKVRLKDITMLFMNTGVGREGYSIIGQGRIAEIISKRSEDRRNIFEEAAGIAKYRYQKEDAERRLGQTQDNMDRVLDIFGELERRIGPLERDAGKAKQYNELYEKKKEADVSLWLYDTQKMRKIIEDCETAVTMSEHELDMAEDTIHRLDDRDARLAQEWNDTKREEELAYANIRSLSRSVSDLDSDLRVMETNKTNAESNTGSEQGEIGRLEDTKEQLTAEIDAAKEKFAALSAKMTEMQKARNELEEARDRWEAKAAATQQEIDDLFDEQTKCEDNRNNVSVRISVLENTNLSGDERDENLRGEIEKYKNETEALRAESAKYKKAVDEFRASLDEMNAAFAEIDAALTEKKASYEEKRTEKGDLDARIAAIRQQVESLKAMEEFFDGYAQSVKFIMQKESIPGAGTVYGPVSRLIDVPEKYSQAVEIALGAGMQHIVVDNDTTAKACIRFLKAENAGRATFYPLNTVTPSVVTPEMQRAASLPGYIGIADSLIGFDPKFKNILSSLLGRTLVFDDLDHASDAAKKCMQRVRIVTLDGQLINAGGSFTGGSMGRSTGMLSRPAQIAKLQAEGEECEKELAEVCRAGAKLGEEIRSLGEKYAKLQQDIEVNNTMLRTELTQYETLEAKIRVNEELTQNLIEDSDKIVQTRLEGTKELEELRKKLEELSARIEEIRELRSDLDTRKYEEGDEADACETKINQCLIAEAEQRKDIETAQLSILDAGRRLEETDAAIKERKERIRQILENLADSDTVVAENRKRHKELSAELTALEQKHNDLQNKLNDLEQKRNALREESKGVYQRKEELTRVNEKNRGKLDQHRVDFDRMVDRLQEEYELTYSTALALGYPEVTEKTRAAVAAVVNECKQKIKSLGSFNANALDEYKEVKERYDTMKVQIDDLTKAKDDLTTIITDMEKKMCEDFSNAFEQINRNFNIVFGELFGGGHAELSLTDPADILNCGIEIKAAPPGKVIKSLISLSGGEQAFVAIALLFAILRVNPTPFCIFDEVEAALDEVNVARFGQYIKRYSKQTQFVIITHRRGTMEIADALYGVTMPDRGISKALRLDVGAIGNQKLIEDKDENAQ